MIHLFAVRKQASICGLLDWRLYSAITTLVDLSYIQSVTHGHATTRDFQSIIANIFCAQRSSQRHYYSRVADRGYRAPLLELNLMHILLYFKS